MIDPQSPPALDRDALAAGVVWRDPHRPIAERVAALMGVMTLEEKVAQLYGVWTAIFAGSDEQAFGVMEAARVKGLRVPDDLSVVGFDDLPMARWSSPPLTTVRQPLADMGRMAGQMLHDLISGGDLPTQRLELATHLVPRASTAPPRS